LRRWHYVGSSQHGQAQDGLPMKAPDSPKKPESPMFFLLALWAICIGFVVLVWYLLTTFVADHLAK
jgi:hypothetical protein